MKALGAVVLGVLIHPVHALAEDACPRTTSSDPLFDAASNGWYGSDGLMAHISRDEICHTTHPGMRIAVKLFWRSPGFRPGSESNLKVEIKNLSGGAMTAKVSGPTNANVGPRTRPWDDKTLNDPVALRQIADQLDTAYDGWELLTGIDFPDPGCWQITGNYLGQKLTFVVETVAAETR